MNSTHTQGLQESPKSRRFGFWSNLGGNALTTAILVHVALLVVAAVWAFHIYPPPDEPVTFVGKPEGGKTPGDPQLPHSSKSIAAPAAQDLARIVAHGAQTAMTLPDAGEEFSNGLLGDLGGQSLGGENGLDPKGRHGPGTAGEDGGLEKGAWKFLPPDFGKRCAKTDRLQRIRENGGTPACEEAVAKGLEWLRNNQAADGSWGSPPAAMTGLALLAYFGHCETPRSPDFGESSLKAIRYLVELGMKNNGRMGSNTSAQPFCYEHAIATYALAEALTFCQESNYEVPNLREVTRQAGQFIIDNQHENGGWSYGYAKTGGHTDVSVTGWQIQALRACSHTPVKFEGMPQSVRKALKYVAGCQHENGGYGYTGPTDGERDGYLTLTGVGMLCNQMWGKNPADVRKAAKYLNEHSEFDYNGASADLYGHYYQSQAMMQRSGSDWKKYNDLFRDQLLNNQDVDGSWKVPGGGKPIRAAGSEYVGNKVYRTSLCILMLEVYYRFLTTQGGTAADRSDI